MNIPNIILQLCDDTRVVWTFLLLLTRYTAFISVVPGIGDGARGLFVRYPAIIVFSLVSVRAENYAPQPDNMVLMAAALATEFLFGMLLGLLPVCIVAGVQTAGQLASTSMGLGAAQLFDPSIGGSQSDLGRIFSGLATILFLMIGGHHVVLMAVSGLSGKIIPGTFIFGEAGAQLIIDRTADIFRAGVMMSAPVIVALLLTQFVMGLVSKAVPTVNIFIVSFPLTIAIGLIISMIALPDIITYLRRDFTGLENSVLVVVDETQHAP